MRCVSYTRFTSCFRRSETPGNVIALQNEAINAYAESKGWKIEQKYSDRKKDCDEAAGFLRLREDGVARKYDCIITMQMERFGPNIFEATKLLEQIFVPAGIRFSIVEDDFFSGDKTKKEIRNYLQEKRYLYKGEHWTRHNKKYYKRIFATYGFKPYSLEEIPKIDEESAEIVRQIFQLYASGVRVVDICQELNERSVETPSKYSERVSGRKICSCKDYWNERVIRRILSDEKYAGKWTRNGYADIVEFQTERIIDEQTFRLIEKKRKEYITTRPAMKHYANAFAKRVFDAETGQLLHYKYVMEPESKAIFYKKWRKRLVEEGAYLLYDDLYQDVMNRILQERKKAEQCRQWLTDPECLQLKEEQKNPIREKALAIADEMATIERKRLENGNNNDVGDLMEELDVAFQKLDERLRDLINEMKAIDVLFSEKNPWVRMFANLRVPETLTSTQTGKWIEKIYVTDLKEINVVFKHEKERAIFPEKIFEEAEGVITK